MVEATLSVSGPQCSVIIPVYNNPSGIRSLLESLEQQVSLMNRSEVVMVDDSSTDETVKVAQWERDRCSFQVKVVQREGPRSSYAARNRGIREARGNIFAFTDSDCRPRKHWLQKGVERLHETSADIAAGAIEITFSDEEPNAWEYLDAALHLDQEKYVKAGWGATANLFVWRETFERFGVFDGSLRSGGDSEFGSRVTSQEGTLVYASKAIVEHPARSTFSEFIEKELRLARGQAESSEGNSIGLKDFLPAYWIPENESYDLSLSQKIKVLLGANLVRWVQAWYRWRTEGGQT